MRLYFRLLTESFMFGAEPQERWTAEEKDNFEQHVKIRNRRMIKAAAWAAGAFMSNLVLIAPFLAGHSLHAYWKPYGVILLFCAYPLFLYLVLRVLFVWSSWQSATETRREFGDPL